MTAQTAEELADQITAEELAAQIEQQKLEEQKTEVRFPTPSPLPNGTNPQSGISIA